MALSLHILVSDLKHMVALTHAECVQIPLQPLITALKRDQLLLITLSTAN